MIFFFCPKLYNVNAIELGYFPFFFFFSIEIQSLFKTFDKNNDKYISSDELGKAMRFLGLNVTKKDVDEAMKVLDKNGMNYMYIFIQINGIFLMTLKQSNATG